MTIIKLEPGALDKLRDIAISHTTLDLYAALYGAAQVALAGGEPYDVYPIALWYCRLHGGIQHSYDTTLGLCRDVGMPEAWI